MRLHVPLLFPPLLFVVILAILTGSGSPARWAESTTFVALPFVLFALAAILGASFAQSRMVFISALLSAVTLRLRIELALVGVSGTCLFFVWLSTLAVPVFTVVLYHMGERSLFSAYGGRRAAGTLVVVIVVLTLAELPLLGELVAAAPGAFWKALHPVLPLSIPGLIVLIGGLVFLAIPKETESPALGYLLAWAVVFVLAGLSFPSAVWPPQHRSSVLLAFMAGSATILVWAVMEGIWRHVNIDELTGLPAKRALKRHLAHLGGRYVIAMVDADHFKQVNDRYGHDTGDQVLRFLGTQLARGTSGTAYRYGGEEFTLVWDGRDQASVAAELESLREAIAGRPFTLRAPDRPAEKPKEVSEDGRGRREIQRISVTVSIGVAEPKGNRTTAQAVMEAADEALYRAKESGRNRVCVAP